MTPYNNIVIQIPNPLEINGTYYCPFCGKQLSDSKTCDCKEWEIKTNVEANIKKLIQELSKPNFEIKTTKSIVSKK